MALAIDEFQRMHEWGGEDAEWALKASMESHPAISYVLAGSKRHVIETMITRKGRALWKQVDAIEFGPIAAAELAEWIHSQGARTGVRISLDAADRIVELAGSRTRDVVQLAREVWFEARTRDEIQPEHVAKAMDQWVRVQIARFRLGPKSTVQKKAVRLVEDEHLVATPEGAYAFDDPFFRRWIEIEVLPDLGLTPA